MGMGVLSSSLNMKVLVLLTFLMGLANCYVILDPSTGRVVAVSSPTFQEERDQEKSFDIKDNFRLDDIDLEQHPERISVPAPDILQKMEKHQFIKSLKNIHIRTVVRCAKYLRIYLPILTSSEKITFEFLIVENKFLVTFLLSNTIFLF